MSEMMHVPDGWEVTEFKNLVNNKTKKSNPLEDSIIVDLENIEQNNGELIFNSLIRDYPKDKIAFKKQNILFGKLRPYLRKYWYCSFEGSCTSELLVLEAKKNIESKYVFYVTQNESFLHFADRFSYGTKMPRVSFNDLAKYKCSVPKEKKEQEKIAKILSTLDKSIETTSCLIEKEKNIKKALMQELLKSGIDKDGHIRTRATHAYKESELGLIPEEWEVVDFKKAINLIDGDRGTNYPKDEDFSEHGYCVFLSAKNVTKDGFRFNEIQFIAKEKDEQLRKGKLAKNDIVLTTRGTVGNIAYFDESIIFQNMRINSGMIILRNQNHILSNDYLYIFLKSGLFEHQIANTVFGSAQPQLTVKEIEKFSICFPNKTEQKQIAKILTTQDKKIETEETNLAKLKELKKGLMSDLLSGKVRVKHY